MKFYLIAGEASGDMHGGALIKEMKKLDPDSQFKAWGGDQIENAGALLVKHYKDINYMGFTEVAKNIFSILRNFSFCKKDIKVYNPDAIILIDYPGFNLRMAKWAKKQGFKVIYYISPQIWAWNSKRIHSIKKNIDKMICILPFEKSFYKKYDYEVEYVGHPLKESITRFKTQSGFLNKYKLENKKFHVLMPGSRAQEIKKHLPIMLELAKKNNEDQFCIAALNHLPENVYNKAGLNDSFSNVQLIYNENYNLLSKAYSAIVSSGTATLETALFDVPQIVIYKGSAISFLFAKKLILVKFISLVNLILDKPLIKELIQNEVTLKNLDHHFNKLKTQSFRSEMINEYQNLNSMLGNQNANIATAKIILEFLK